MHKLKIGNKLFELNGYYKTELSSRPSFVFMINDKYETVYPLTQSKNTYILILETQIGNTEEVDITDKCVIFSSLKNLENKTCELIMSDYAPIEKAQQTINDLEEIIDVLSEEV